MGKKLKGKRTRRRKKKIVEKCKIIRFPEYNKNKMIVIEIDFNSRIVPNVETFQI